MKLVKQLTLVAAVAAASGSAFAMEALTDEALSQKTGQDGITVTITPDQTNGVSIQELLIHDNDGLATGTNFAYGKTAAGAVNNVSLGGTGNDGAIVVDNLTIKAASGGGKDGNITIDLDTDGGSASDGSGAFINASVGLNGKHTIGLDGVYVGKSKATASAYTGAAQRGTEAKRNKILGGLELSMTNAKVNAQLGAQPQGAMVLMAAELEGGLSIKNLEVIDSNGHGTTGNKQGGLMVKEVTLTDADSANFSLLQKIDIDADKGIVITMNSPSKGYYAYMQDVGISDGEGVFTGAGYTAADNTATPAVAGVSGNNIIGDVEIVGLKTGNTTIAIKGH